MRQAKGCPAFQHTHAFQIVRFQKKKLKRRTSWSIEKARFISQTFVILKYYVWDSSRVFTDCSYTKKVGKCLLNIVFVNVYKCL